MLTQKQILVYLDSKRYEKHYSKQKVSMIRRRTGSAAYHHKQRARENFTAIL
jgi:hypothetical protein